MLGDSTITRASVLLADFPAVFFLFCHETIENPSTDNLSRAIKYRFTGLIFYPILNSPNVLLNARIPWKVNILFFSYKNTNWSSY